MKTVSATDAKQRLAALLDAAQREPVLIRRHNRDAAVIISAEEYDRIRKASIADSINQEIEMIASDPLALKCKIAEVNGAIAALQDGRNWATGQPNPDPVALEHAMKRRDALERAYYRMGNRQSI